LANGETNLNIIGNIIGVTFILHSLVALIGAKGKHLSWPVFLAIGVLAFYASNT